MDGKAQNNQPSSIYPRNLARSVSAGIAQYTQRHKSSVSQTISLPFPKPRVARLSVKKKQDENSGLSLLKPPGAITEKGPPSPSSYITQFPDRKVRLAVARKRLSQAQPPPVIENDSIPSDDYLNILMPQETLVNAINLNKTEFLRDFEVDLILPKINQFLSPSQMEDILRYESKEKKTSWLIEAVSESSHIRALMKTFIGFLAGIHPKHFERVKGRAPTEEETLCCLRDYIKDKKRLIIKRGNDLVSDSDKQMNLETDYIQLYLIKSDKVAKDEGSENGLRSAGDDDQMAPPAQFLTNHGVQIDAKDLIDRRFIQGRKVTIKGRGGIGKTTLLQWLSYEWAKERVSMPFTLLFLLQLRVLLTIDYPVSLLQLLNTYCQFATGRPVSESLLTKWMHNWGHLVLVMLDGVDEIKDLGYKLRYTRSIKDITEEALPMDIFINLLRGDLLSEGKIIMTTRPTLGLHAPQCDISVEVMGLTRDGIREYIEKNVPREHAFGIAGLLLQNPSLMSLCSITYYCVVLCSLLIEDSSIAEKDINTYTRLTSCIIMKMASRSNGQHSPGEGTEYKTYLYKLAKLAFWAVFCREPADGCTTLFDVKDMAYAELTKEDLEQANHDGIIHITEAFNDKKCKTKKFLFQFTHLTIQELFASVFFLDGDTVTKNERKRVLDWVFRHGYFNMAILFIFGLRFDTCCEYIQKLRFSIQYKRFSAASLHRRFKTMFDNSMDGKLLDYLKNISKSAGVADNQDYKLQVAHLLYESNRPEMSEWLAESNTLVKKDGTLQIKDVALTAVDVMALVHVAKQSRKLKFLHLVCVNMDDASFKKIAEFLVERNSLQILNLSHNFLSSNSCQTLEIFLPYGNHLTTVHLDGVGFGDDGVLSVVNGLLPTSSLRSLSFDSNGISDKGVGYLVRDTVPKLNTLSLNDNSITDVGIMNICFSEMLASLKGLFLGYNQISITGANYLLTKFSGDELNLRGNQIDLQRMKRNADSKVQLIDLQENETGGRRIRVLIDQIKGGKSFQVLDLENMGINDYSFVLLAKSLVGSPKLQRLNLAKNRLSKRSGKAIKVLTFTCPALEEVHVSGNSLVLDGSDAFEGAGLKKNVKYLDLSRSMTPAGFKQLAPLIRNNTSLECLTLNYNDVQPEELNYLIRGLKHCRNLTHLELSSTNLGYEHSESLSKVIKQCSSLLSLDLSKNKIDFNTMVSMSDVLRGNPKLEYMNLNHNNIRDKGVEELFHAIQNNVHLSILQVASNNIEPPGMLTIAEALASNLAITSLDLSHNAVDERALEAISRALVRTRHLEDLRLQDLSISPEGAKYLADGLARNVSLKYLNLFQNNMRDVGASAIAEALSRNETLKKIILRANQIGSDGIAAIAHALIQNKDLQCLDVGMNKIGPTGAKEISTALKQNNTLVDLGLSFSELDHGAVWYITDALKTNQSLLSLALGWNDIKSRGLIYMANALLVNNHLRALDLCENNIGSGGALVIADHLMRNTSLVHLNMEGNQLHAVGVDALIRTVRARTDPLYVSLLRNGVFVGSAEEILARKKPPAFSTEEVQCNLPDYGNEKLYGSISEVYYNRAFTDTYYKHRSYENVEYYVQRPLSIAEHEYLNTPLYVNVGPGTLRPAAESNNAGGAEQSARRNSRPICLCNDVIFSDRAGQCMGIILED